MPGNDRAKISFNPKAKLIADLNFCSGGEQVVLPQNLLSNSREIILEANQEIEARKEVVIHPWIFPWITLKKSLHAKLLKNPSRNPKNIALA